MELSPYLPTSDLNPHQKQELGTLQCPSLHATLRRENTDLAYLLGAWAATATVGVQPDDRIAYASKDIRQTALVEERMVRVVGKSPSHQHIVLNGEPYQRIMLHNEEVAQHFHRVTAHNSRLPWEHIGTEQECIHYLRGMFDHGGWIFHGSSSGIGIKKRDGEHLMRDIGRVFAKIGIFPLISYGELPTLRLKEKNDWALFAAKIGLSLPDRQQEAQALADLPSLKNHFGLKDYAAVQRCIEAGNLSASAISKSTGVPANSVRDWIIRGQKPPVVKRKEIIDAYSQTMANPDVVNFVYRHLGASSQLARECGMRTSIERVTDIALQESSSIGRIYGDDSRLAKLLLGSWATPT
jgi:hypothetical protein